MNSSEINVSVYGARKAGGDGIITSLVRDGIWVRKRLFEQLRKGRDRSYTRIDIYTVSNVSHRQDVKLSSIRASGRQPSPELSPSYPI